MRAQVSALDGDLPVFAIQTLDEAVAMGRNSNRMIGSWFVAIALVALVLATVGLYALTAHGVAQRTQEIGVRMALGAQAPQVVWLFVRRTIVQLMLGLALGLRLTSASVSGSRGLPCRPGRSGRGPPRGLIELGSGDLVISRCRDLVTLLHQITTSRNHQIH